MYMLTIADSMKTYAPMALMIEAIITIKKIVDCILIFFAR